ncbi:MAG: DUF1684 domain-containing protein, partial [Saprospiraceae bacterium]|nr:DUF1684 domain-containing protein [Saprospiraceae bacterium]
MKNAYIIRTLLSVLLFLQITSPLISQSKKEMIAYRKTHLDELLADPRKPITPEEKNLIKYFSYKKSWQVEAEYVPLEKEPVFQMPTYSGVTRDYRKFATATFTHGPEKITVYLYQNMTLIRQPQFKDYLFLPFKDDTNGVESYGGGRYMDVRLSTVKDGKIILNFNKAYNP